MHQSAIPAALLILVALALLISGLHPYDRATWWMETAPVFIAAPIAIHALILLIGGAYTYARVPFGFWLQDLLAFERNPYDRIGH